MSQASEAHSQSVPEQESDRAPSVSVVGIPWNVDSMQRRVKLRAATRNQRQTSSRFGIMSVSTKLVAMTPGRWYGPRRLHAKHEC